MKCHKSAHWNRKADDIIVITGCDSGIGRSVAELLSSKGQRLVVSYLNENHFATHKNVRAVKLDLTRNEEVDQFIHIIEGLRQNGHRIAAVITNAGVALGGPIEDIPMELYRRTYDINLFGAISVIKATIPSIIEAKGRIMIIGSMAGKIAMPFLSPYASSKFALEGFCDSLRRELNPFGIKTIMIEPAAVATPIWNKALDQDISFVQAKYLDSLYSFKENFIEGGNYGMPSAHAAEQIVEILSKKKPKERYIIADNQLTSFLTTLVPQWYIDKAVVKMFAMNYGEKQSK